MTTGRFPPCNAMLAATREIHRLIERWANGQQNRGEDVLDPEHSMAVTRALEKLTPKERLVLEERYLRTGGMREMAARLGMSSNSFGVYLHNARQKLISALIRD
jgi:RNA polymerase sigma factor (sigma-70 family)